MMNRSTAGLALSVLLAFSAVDAQAKIRVRSHGSGSSHGHSSPDAPDAPHAKPNGGGNTLHFTPRHHNGSSSASQGSDVAGAAGDPGDETLRRVRAEKEAARAKAQSEQLEAQRHQQEIDAESRRLASERAALALAEERKRQTAEERARQQEEMQRDRLIRQAAWERRCEIKAVMTDEEIAVCREVHTRPAP